MEGMLILFILFLVSGPIIALIALAKSNRIGLQLDEVTLEVARLEFQASNPAPPKPKRQEIPEPKKKEPVANATPPPLPPPTISWDKPKPKAPNPKPAPATPVKPRPVPTQTLQETAPKDQPKAPTGIDWKAWLERLHLCPPDKETNGEVGLAAWWTTRIGILLAVIAVVFLGVYVNHLTAPWVRFVELLGIAGGVFTLGWWLEKRMGRFGEIVSAGGLSMLYFAAYASHGVAAVQVTTDPWLGTLFQVGALGLMLLWSDRKRDANLSALGIGLGYVSCGFAAAHGLAAMTLGGLVLLGIVGSVLLVKRSWRLPFLVSTVGSYAGLLLFAWQQGAALSLSAVFIAAMAMLSTFSLALMRPAHGKEDSSTWLRRASLAQASGASFVTLAGTLLLEPSQLSAAYILLFIAFTIHAVISWRKVAFPMLFPAWTLKALTFLALFIVAEFEGPTRWLGLAAQSFALLWTMRNKERTPLWLEAGFWALWGTSFALFLNDSVGWHAESFVIEDPRRLVSWGYLAVALLIATLYHRPWGSSQIRTDRQQSVGLVMALAIGMGSAQSFLTDLPNVTPIIPLLGLCAIFLVMANWQRSWLPLIPSAFLLVTGHGLLWLSQSMPHSWSMLAFLSISLGGLAYLAAYHTRRDPWAAFTAPIWVAFVTISGLILATRTHSPSGFQSYLTFFIVSGLAVTGSRYLLTGASFHIHIRQGILLLLGMVLAGYATVAFEAVLVPWSLLITVGVLLGLCKVCSDHSIAGAAMPSAILGAITYIHGPTGMPWSAAQDLLLGFGMIMSLGAGAWALAKHRSEEQTWPTWVDGILHTTSLLVFFQGLSRHVDPSLHGVLIGLTTLALCLVAKRLPFPTLAWVTWLLPVLLLVFGAGHFDQPAAWLTSGLLLAAWRCSSDARRPAIWISASCLLWTILNASTGGIAHVAIVTAMGLGYALLYHFLKEEESADVSLVVGLASTLLGITMLLDPTGHQIGWILLSCLGLAIQGWLLKPRTSQFRLWRDTLWTWLFGAAALVIAQIAVATPAFGVNSMITPYWGFASIALFVGGLFGGLRAYRMIGLLGLITCIIRMFAVDIDDTFNRITAFAVVAIVLLGVGYLYTRFRGWIEQQDDVSLQS